MAETSEPGGEDEAEWPRGTLALSSLILCVYLAECLAGLEGPERGVALVRSGAVGYSYVFEAGEWWRLVTAAFCHGHVIHLLLNGWAFIQLGALVEDLCGHARFLVVFLLSCLGGTIASAAVGTAASVGASGGVMGLLGFLAAARYVHQPDVRDFLERALGRQLLFWIAFILGVGWLIELQGVALVDNYGHMGGLFTGTVLAFVLQGPSPASLVTKGVAAALSALVAISLLAVAAYGEESARLEQAFEEAYRAHQKNDVAAVRSALAAIDAIPGNPRRVVGRDLDRARELVLASIAAVRTADAVAYGRLAAELDPHVGSTVLAQALYAAGEPAKGRAALEAYRKTASLQELVVVATHLERQGLSTDAVLFFEAALEKEPDSANALNNLAWTLLTAKDRAVHDPHRALNLARRAYAREPLNAAYVDTLAEAEFQLGHVHLALDHAEKAVQLALATQDPQANELIERLDKIRAAAK